MTFSQTVMANIEEHHVSFLNGYLYLKKLYKLKENCIFA